MEAVDTLAIYERLKKAKLNDAAAREIAEVLRETIATQAATKADLEAAKTEIIKWVAGMLVAQAAIVATLVKLL